MSNEIVKYKNELNDIPLRRFTPNEMNLFFSIISRMRDKGEKTVRFYWRDLKILSQYKPTSIERFAEDLNKTYSKMLELTYGHKYIGKKTVSVQRFVLFTNFEISNNVILNEDNTGSLSDYVFDKEKDGYVDITVNPKFSYILNDLLDGFTRYSLEQFVDLKSTYSKTMFRLLKQYRTTGYRKFSLEEFRTLLDIPQSYKISHIDQKVIKPIRNELSDIFDNLRIEKLHSRSRGNKVLGFEFKFTPEKIDSINNKTSYRKLKKKTKTETLPDWAKQDMHNYEEQPVDQFLATALQEQLQEIRKGR